MFNLEILSNGVSEVHNQISSLQKFFFLFPQKPKFNECLTTFITSCCLHCPNPCSACWQAAPFLEPDLFLSFNPSKKQTVFLGVKLSLPGHGDPFNVFYSGQLFCIQIIVFTTLSVFSTSMSEHRSHQQAACCPCWKPSMRASRGTQTNACLHTWAFLCIQQKYNLAAVIKHHRNDWQLQAKQMTHLRANTENHIGDYTLKK